MRPLYVYLAAGFLAVLSGGLWFASTLGQGDDRFAQCRTSQIAGGTAQIGGPFKLVNAKGETVTDKDVITEPTLIYFGYTFCPDVCPLDMSRNADAVDLLAAKGQMVTPVFITVDPERDTPEVVGDFAANIHERAIGLTGSPAQIKAASQAYRSYYKAHPEQGEFYMVDHSTFSYLVLPQIGFVDYFRHEESADTVADRIGCFLDKA